MSNNLTWQTRSDEMDLIRGSLSTAVLLPSALGVVMFGLGMSLTLADFKRVLLVPKAIFLGLSIQTILLTAVCAAIVIELDLPPELAVGMMLLAAAPGGASANIFSYLAHGDVALNITLTAINSVLALITLPIIVGVSLKYFVGTEAYVPPPLSKIVEVSLVIIVPVTLGMWVRAKAARFAVAAEPFIRIGSVVVLVTLSILALWWNRAILVDHGASIVGACLLFNVVSMLIGYSLPRLLGLSEAQATAIAMEIGIHNAALAMFVAIQVLGKPEYAAPAAIYAFVMAFTAGLFTLWMWRKQRRVTTN